jgi:flagellar biosynthesis/type III secretory pathway protein FliH
LAKQVVATAVTAARDIDNERTTLYLDFIFSHLKDTPQVLEEAMSSLEFKYQSDFARRYVAEGLATGKAEGLAEGAAEGRAEIILEQLATRFGPLPDSIRTRVRGATAAQLHAVAKRLLTAQSLEEALESI